MDITIIGALIGLAISIVLIIFKAPPVMGLLCGAFIGGIICGFGMDGTINAMLVGAQGMVGTTLRILASGILVGALVESKSTDRIAESIIKAFGVKYAIIAIPLATMIICAIGIFVPVAILTIAPIAIKIGAKANISPAILIVAMDGGGKAGNIISPNPNTIAAAQSFGAGLTQTMYFNTIPAICALVATIIICILMLKSHQKKHSIDENAEQLLKGSDKTDVELGDLPPLWKAIIGPCVVIVLLLLRQICGITIDPMIALPVGGLVCIVVTGNIRKIMECLKTGFHKIAGTALLIIAVGTISGIINSSNLSSVMISALEKSSLPMFMLIPISGMLLSCATASTTAGVSLAGQAFAPILLESGVPAIAGAAMLNASGAVLGNMPHGSLFSASAIAVRMEMKERSKLIPIELIPGFVGMVVSLLVYII